MAGGRIVAAAEMAAAELAVRPLGAVQALAGLQRLGPARLGQAHARAKLRGTSVAVGQPAFMRGGIVEGLAPARVAVTIEI
jgi:hypothetical protein